MKACSGTKTPGVTRASILIHSVAVLLFALASPGTTAAPAGLLQRAGVPSLAPLMETVTPAVVNIAVLAQSPGSANPLFDDPFFQRFFQRQPPRLAQSAGSGVIIDAQAGLVLTNHHVVEHAREVRVTLKDGRSFDAELLGSDRGTDIAVLRIEARDLAELPFGDSDDLQVGDFVLAIGNPFGLGQTVTSGIVSALGRSTPDENSYQNFIQTDASINPGNSGGALVDLRGRLIGINSAIIGASSGNVGIGFAVPSNMASAVMNQLTRFGDVSRGRLGVLIQDLSAELAATMNLPSGQRGALISRIEPGSGAERSDLRAGDIIIEVDGKPVRNSNELRNRIGVIRAGRSARVLVLRDGQRVRAEVDVNNVGSGTGEQVTAVEGSPLSGATFQALSEAAAQTRGTRGVLISSVVRGSPAARNGMREGDLVIAINRARVRDLNELEYALQRAGNRLAINLLRGRANLVITIR